MRYLVFLFLLLVSSLRAANIPVNAYYTMVGGAKSFYAHDNVKVINMFVMDPGPPDYLWPASQTVKRQRPGGTFATGTLSISSGKVSAGGGKATLTAGYPYSIDWVDNLQGSVLRTTYGGTLVAKFGCWTSWDWWANGGSTGTPETGYQSPMQVDDTFVTNEVEGAGKTGKTKTYYRTYYAELLGYFRGSWNLNILTTNNPISQKDYCVRWEGRTTDSIYNVSSKNPPEAVTLKSSWTETVDAESNPPRTVTVWRRVVPGTWVQIYQESCPFGATLILNDTEGAAADTDTGAPETPGGENGTAEQTNPNGTGTGNQSSTGGTGLNSPPSSGPGSGPGGGSSGGGGTGEPGGGGDSQDIYQEVRDALMSAGADGSGSPEGNAPVEFEHIDTAEDEATVTGLSESIGEGLATASSVREGFVGKLTALDTATNGVPTAIGKISEVSWGNVNFGGSNVHLGVSLLPLMPTINMIRQIFMVALCIFFIVLTAKELRQ